MNPPSGPSGAPVPAAEALGFLRSRRRARRTMEERLDRLYYLYLVLLAAGFLALYAHSLLGGLLLGGRLGAAGTARLVEGAEGLGPAVFLISVLHGLRYSTWQGPVVFSRADVTFLLSAPIARAELVRAKLLRGLAGGAVIGAALGFMVFMVLDGALGADALPLLAACLAGPGALGLLTMALGWQIERSLALSQALLRYEWLVYPLAATLALASILGGQDAADLPALLSGPWGWAVSPIIAATGGGAPHWPVAAVLLASTTALAVAYALSRAGGAPTGELSRRAELRRGLFTSLYLMDYRGAVLLRRGVSRGLTGLRLLRLPRPGRPLLAVPWRDVLWASRSPGRVGWSVILSGGAAFAVLAAPASPTVVVAAILAAYLAAARLVEPMRIETDAPGASRRLPYRYGDLVLLHGLVPSLVLASAGMLACIIGLFVGLLPAASLLPSLAACLLVVVDLVLCAAVAAQRSRTLPVELLISASALGDVGGMPILLWYARGPLLAGLTLGVPAALVLPGASQGSTVPPGTLIAAAASVVMVLVIGLGWLKGREIPE